MWLAWWIVEFLKRSVSVAHETVDSFVGPLSGWTLPRLTCRTGYSIRRAECIRATGKRRNVRSGKLPFGGGRVQWWTG